MSSIGLNKSNPCDAGPMYNTDHTELQGMKLRQGGPWVNYNEMMI